MDYACTPTDTDSDLNIELEKRCSDVSQCSNSSPHVVKLGNLYVSWSATKRAHVISRWSSDSGLTKTVKSIRSKSSILIEFENSIQYHVQQRISAKDFFTTLTQ